MFNNKRILLFCVVLCLLISAFAGCSRTEQKKDNMGGYEITDELGTKVSFESKPKKLLTNTYSADMIVLGMRGYEVLLGISHLADDPYSSNIVDIAKRIPRKIKMPTAEEILALNPDVLFVYDWSKKEMVDNLRELGIKVVVLKSPQTINDVKRNVTTVAAALQEQEKGQDIIRQMDAKLAEIQGKLAKIPPEKHKKVLLISLMTNYGGKGSLYDDMCKYAGVVNGISAIGLKHGQYLTKEIMLKINPDILFLSSYNGHNTFDIKKHNEEFLNDPSLQTMQAIKDKHLEYPREGYLYNNSQDCVFGVQEIARVVYGADFDLPDGCHIVGK